MNHIPPTAPVNRDPCPRCGVRGDIGCAHQRPVESWDPFAHLRAAAPVPAASPPPATTVPPKETIMPNPKPSENFQTVSFPARGEVLAALKQRAGKFHISLPRAAIDLIEHGIEKLAALEAPVPADSAPAPTGAEVLLANLLDTDLLAEPVRRFESCVGSDDYAAAVARADAAEARLARVQAAFAGEAA